MNNTIWEVCQHPYEKLELKTIDTKSIDGSHFNTWNYIGFESGLIYRRTVITKIVQETSNDKVLLKVIAIRWHYMQDKGRR